MFNVLLRLLLLLSWSCCWLSALFYLMQWVVLPLPPASHWDVRPGSVNSTLTTEQTSSTTDTSEGWVELRAWWDRTPLSTHLAIWSLHISQEQPENASTNNTGTQPASQHGDDNKKTEFSQNYFLPITSLPVFHTLNCTALHGGRS